MKQNTEQLKKEFSKLYCSTQNTSMGWISSPKEVWDFFLPHLISSDEREEVFCNLLNHPDGIDCYGQKILTQEQYNLRGINTAPVCKQTTTGTNLKEQNI